MSESITYLPLSALRESPFNPRKRYNEADIAELADSLRSQGMLQPMVARPLTDDQADIDIRYELIFGHRRFRAAQLANPELFWPVIVRAASDQEAAIAQLHENGKRKDPDAIEEADAMLRLHKEHGMSADDIAAQLSMSRSYVYGRIKLANACDKVREAVTQKALSPEIALEIARIRAPKLQAQALDRVHDHYTGGWMSYRGAKQALAGLFRLHVDEAPFDPEDAKLLPRIGTCSACPKRAGNDPDLVDSYAADVCTDSDCYQSKCANTARITAAALRQEGATVLEGDDAKDAFKTHTPATRMAFWLEGGRSKSYSEARAELVKAGVTVPPLVYVVTDPSKGVHAAEPVVPDDAVEHLQAAWDKLQEQQADAPANGKKREPFSLRSGGNERPSYEGWSAAERVTADAELWVNVKLAVLANLVKLPRTTDDLRAMLLREYDCADSFGLYAEAVGLQAEKDAAEAAADEAGQEFFERDWWVERLKTMTADQLGAMALGVALEDQLGHGGGWQVNQERAAGMVALAKAYGVDPASFAAQPEQADLLATEPASTPSSAGASADKGKLTPPAGVAYWCPQTGATWSGKGKRPEWLRAKIAGGAALADFEVKKVKVDAGAAGEAVPA